MKKIVNGKVIDMTPAEVEAHQQATAALEAAEAPHRYKHLRADAYPRVEDYLDAKVKQASGDPALVAEGEQQEADYLSACLAVKAQFPKPEVLNE